MENTPDIASGFNRQVSVFFLGFLLPFVVFYAIYSSPIGSIIVDDFLMHQALIFIVASFSVYTSYYYYKLYITSPKPALLYSSLGTFVFVLIFLAHEILMVSHGMSPREEMFFDVTEHYSLFISALFFIGVLSPFKEETGFLYKNRKKIYACVAALLLAIIAWVISSEQVIRVLHDILPLIIVSTGIIFLALSLFLFYSFSKTQNLLYLYFIFGFMLLASSGYVPFFYSDWSVLWWYSFLTFPAGYTAIFIGLINYERGDLDLRLFFGEIPFYKKLGTKLAVTIFTIGLIPLFIFGGLVFISIQDTLSLTGNAEGLYLLLFRFVLMMSLLFVLASFFSLYFAGKLVLPLKKLKDAANKISKGETCDNCIDIKTGDEMEMVADAFNKMTADLDQLHSGMETTISEQTSELSEKLSNLNETKKALFNLLEDSKVLEERLAEEKASVERKVTERTQELEIERSRLLASINSLSFGFAIVGVDHSIILRNNSLIKLLGFSETDVVSIDKIQDALGKNFNIKKEAGKCILGTEVCEIKEILFGKKFLRGIVAPIVTAKKDSQKDETIGYVLLLEDITEAKVMERSRDEFFAVASHELRTPLTAIRGNADMILDMYADKITDKDMKEMLQDIDLSSIRLINIVNDFLEVSRLEQGRIEMKKENFAITDIVEKVIRDLKEMINKRSLSLVYTAPTTPLPLVTADKDRLEQILINLVGNSSKFTKEGSITLDIQSEGEFLKVSIADTGLGISEQNQALLFRKFQQAGEQMLARDVSQSTGLGLYICRLIMNAMGGEIGLEKSELGKGSTFYFTVPIAS